MARPRAGGGPAGDAHARGTRGAAPGVPVRRARRNAADLGVPAAALRVRDGAAVPGLLPPGRPECLRRCDRVHRRARVGGGRGGRAADRRERDRAADRRGRRQRRRATRRRVHGHARPARPRGRRRGSLRPHGGGRAQALGGPHVPHAARSRVDRDRRLVARRPRFALSRPWPPRGLQRDRRPVAVRLVGRRMGRALRRQPAGRSPTRACGSTSARARATRPRR